MNNSLLYNICPEKNRRNVQSLLLVYALQCNKTSSLRNFSYHVNDALIIFDDIRYRKFVEFKAVGHSEQSTEEHRHKTAIPLQYGRVISGVQCH